MRVLRPLASDFTAGELSAKMTGRVDLAVHQRGLQTLENFFVLPQGGVTKRAGTEYQGLCYGSTNAARIIPFIYTATEAYIIELTAGYLRVWRNGSVVASSSSPTYTAGELFDIHYSQDHYGIYFTHANHAPAALIRTATDTFTWGSVSFRYHIGGYYQGHATVNDTDDESFVVQSAIAATVPQEGVLRVLYSTGMYDEYTYSSWTGSSFLGVSPALVRDYDAGDFALIGHAYHTNNATVPFGSTYNYPAVIGIADGRMLFGATIRDRQTLWAGESFGSRVESGGLYVDMLMYEVLVTAREEQTPSSEWADPAVPETETVTHVRAAILDDSALQFELASGQADAIQWIAAGRNVFVGTTMGEWMLPEGLSARAPRAQLMTRVGSDNVQPQMVWDMLMFLQAGGKQLRGYRYEAAQAGYKPPDLTLYADHILGTGGAVQMDFTQDPRCLVLFVRSDGELAVLAYEPDAGVAAWQRWTHASGTFTSVAVIPESGQDVVYVVVKRGSNYYLEKFTDPFPATQSACVFMDSSYDVTADDLSRVSGDTLTCTWLASATVALVVDGAFAGTVTASAGGAIDLTGYSGTQVYAGLQYTAKLQTMPVASVVEAGANVLDRRRISRVQARVYRSLDIKSSYDSWLSSEAQAYDLGADWFTGNIEIDYPGDYDEDADVRIFSDRPLPCTVLVLLSEVVQP